MLEEAKGVYLITTPWLMVELFGINEVDVPRKTKATWSVELRAKVPLPRVRVLDTVISSLRIGGVSVGAKDEATPQP